MERITVCCCRSEDVGHLEADLNWTIGELIPVQALIGPFAQGIGRGLGRDAVLCAVSQSQ